MAERSFSQLPISSSHIGRRMLNTRRGVFPVSEYWIHAIPVIVFLCFFTLWIFSHSVSVNMNDGEIMSIHRLAKPIDVTSARNESHVSLAILASSAVSPASGFVSANQNLTAHHNATQSHNITQSHNVTQSVKKKSKKAKKAKKPLAG